MLSPSVRERNMNSKLKIFLLFLIALVRFCFMCPNTCSCKWKHGKQTADCDGKGLTVIPSGVKPGTQVIDLSRNNFNELLSRAFQEKKLVNLQKIYLSECGISKIAVDAFFQLTNLVELDLSHNNLKKVPTKALSECPNLRRLQMAHNSIETLENGAFSPLSHLTYLDLSNCQIESIHSGALNGLEKLDVIELDGNRINTLSVDVFKSVTLLFGLHLHNNPWHCDCRVRELRTWMINRNIPLSVPPHCESPLFLKGYAWDILPLEDFACVPKMLNVPKEVKVIAGQNASIHCQVSSIPKSLIYWEVAGRSLKNITCSTEPKLKLNVECEESSTLQSSVLTIYNTVDSDSDMYTCMAENKAGLSFTNFTLTVLCPNSLTGSWNNSEITLLLFGILFGILLSAAIICLLVYQPVSLAFCSKIHRKNILSNMATHKQDAVEMNDVREDKDLKMPRHETDGSGHFTPDLVSKIPDVSNGDNWHASVPNSVLSEIYLNPCYGKDDDVYKYALKSAGAHQLPDCAHELSLPERYIPQNDQVRGDYESPSDIYNRYPLVVSGHYTLPSKSTFLPDECLDGTEV